MPKTIAVVGASSDRHKFGNKALRAYREQGYAVIPINPNEREVEGLKTYPSVRDVPGTIDVATVYVQPHITGQIIEDCEEKGIPEVWINPGAETDEMIDSARNRKTKLIFACSILAVGRSPHEF